MKDEKQKAVITVIGKDQVGILANVSTACAAANCNVEEVTQSVLSDFFCMIMISFKSYFSRTCSMPSSSTERTWSSSSV